MLRALPALIGIVLAIYCLVDLVQSQASEVRLLPRWAWALIIIGIPIVGPIGWLTLGRPQNSSPSAGKQAAGGSGPARSVAPDDNPEFLEQLKRQRAQREQEEKLRAWEKELKEREERLDEPGDDPAPDTKDDSAAPDQPTHPAADDDPGNNPSNGR